VRLLLDTHALLWWLSDDERLPAWWRPIIADPSNDVGVSVVSAAEIAIKASLGKLEAPPDLRGAIEQSGLTSLALELEHAEAVRNLPWHHRDPFDRLLIAQAEVEQLTVATVDRNFLAYDVAVLPARQQV
jgi:PIN domain nuclease of toxin-antitoxin system